MIASGPHCIIYRLSLLLIACRRVAKAWRWASTWDLLPDRRVAGWYKHLEHTATPDEAEQIVAAGGSRSRMIFGRHRGLSCSEAQVPRQRSKLKT